MIRTGEEVFLGVVVNPKTKDPVFVMRPPGSGRDVRIYRYNQGTLYTQMGAGYLAVRDDDEEYLLATMLTGYPRAHTPDGVYEKKMGYGTCLYTGLVMLATAAADGDLHVANYAGHGRAVCSSAGSRSDEADEWWKAAKRRGITTQQRGSVEIDAEDKEEEELTENERLSEHISTAAMVKVAKAIKSAVADWGYLEEGGWITTVNEVDVDITRMVPVSGGDVEEVEADIYTMVSAASHNLFALRVVHAGTIKEWTRDAAPERRSETTDINKDVLLALNVARQDPMMVGQLALFARAAGAGDGEITRMLMRNKFGYDTMHLPSRAPVEFDGAISATQRRRNRGPRPTLTPNPPHTMPAYRRNPSPAPTPSERSKLHEASDELEALRKKLGWDQLEDLP